MDNRDISDQLRRLVRREQSEQNEQSEHGETSPSREHQEDSFRERLRRLGVVRGTDHLNTRRRRPIETLLDGQVCDTALGSHFLYRESYPLEYQHGSGKLSDLLAHSSGVLAWLARDERLNTIDLDRIAFIDTETTGLAGGTGTYAFLIGVGVFEDEQFTIHQFFMRDYEEEPAQIQALGNLLDGMEAVASFNGKSFDLPLLETRFLMVQQEPRLTTAPHLDLLPLARLFWKYRLPSRALSALETEILGVQRSHKDAPGWLVPSLYRQYLESRDASDMPRIFYHNAQDILSMVTLTAHMGSVLTAPTWDPETVPGEDLVGLGRLLLNMDHADRAEAAYRQAADTCTVTEVRERAMRDLAHLLKRQERRQEALSWWQRLVDDAGVVYACEELAKHYEWHDVELGQALSWTERALTLAAKQLRGAKRREALSELEHRRERLQKKIQGTAK